MLPGREVFWAGGVGVAGVALRVTGLLMGPAAGKRIRSTREGRARRPFVHCIVWNALGYSGQDHSGRSWARGKAAAKAICTRAKLSGVLWCLHAPLSHAIMFLSLSRAATISGRAGEPVRLEGGERSDSERLRPKVVGGKRRWYLSNMGGLGEVEGLGEDRVEVKVQVC